MSDSIPVKCPRCGKPFLPTEMSGKPHMMRFVVEGPLVQYSKEGTRILRTLRDPSGKPTVWVEHVRIVASSAFIECECGGRVAVQPNRLEVTWDTP